MNGEQPEGFSVTDRRRVSPLWRLQPDGPAPAPGDATRRIDPRQIKPPADVDESLPGWNDENRAHDDPTFADVIEEARRRYRPGVPDDELPGETTYAAACAGCVQATADAVQEGKTAIPFATAADRDRWAAAHAREHGHTVALISQHPRTGSTITGYADPPVRGAAAGDTPALPLVAFVARADQQPDLMCRIGERAGAAWLLHAAHACLLGRGAGSVGIERAHRVLYIGRLSRVDRVKVAETPEFLDDTPPHAEVTPGHWQVRVDGLLGATGPEFGRPVGATLHVDGALDVPSAEQVVEGLIASAFAIGRHLFSVILMADAAVNDPPDADADAALRRQGDARADGSAPENCWSETDGEASDDVLKGEYPYPSDD